MRMDVFNYYSLGTAAWLGIQAAPLVFTPKLIITLLSPDVHQVSSLEEYFSRSLGISLTTIAFLCLFLSGAFPLSSPFEETTSAGATTSSNPYAVPTLIITTIYHSSASFYTYSRYNRKGQATYVLAAVTSAVLAFMGLWVLMFGSDKGHISRRTGADKRTSGWPFGNAEANKKRVPKPKKF